MLLVFQVINELLDEEGNSIWEGVTSWKAITMKTSYRTLIQKFFILATSFASVLASSGPEMRHMSPK